jgi:hypothetical protein
MGAIYHIKTIRPSTTTSSHKGAIYHRLKLGESGGPKMSLGKSSNTVPKEGGAATRRDLLTFGG